MLMHPTSDRPQQDHWTDRSSQSKGYSGPSPNRRDNNKTFTCPVCKKRVDLSDDVNKSILEHFETHSQTSRVSEADNDLYTFNGIRDWMKQSEGSDRNNRKFKSNFRDGKFKQNPSAQSFGFKQHEGYIQSTGGRFACNICNAPLDSKKSVEEHIKTKTHEDNIILDLKNKFPVHLQCNMDFISFYNSTLSCNLCRYRIQSNSLNSFETIVHIISHNSEKMHSSKRSNKDGEEPLADVADTTLKLLLEKHPRIRDNKHLLASSMEPKYKCVLCDKNILYDAKENKLAKNFLAHLESSLHKKAVKAVGVLQSFEAMHIKIDPGHKFIISNGCITCIPCKCNMDSEVNELLAHIQGKSKVNADNYDHKSQASSSGSKTARTFTKPQTSNNPQLKTQKEWKRDTTSNVNVQKLLKPLFREFGHISCISEQKDQVSCLICECIIPPTTQNIEMHMRGASHKKKCEEQIRDNTNNYNSISDNSQYHNLRKDDFIEELFKSLPYMFEGDKQHIKRCQINGYISCSLCNNCIINPHYLKSHLLDESHRQRMHLT